MNETHDPALRSWVSSANAPACDFTIQNLPFAVFRQAGRQQAFRGGVAIGDQIVDLGAVHAAKLFDGLPADAVAACAGTELNPLLEMGPRAWSALRLALSQALRSDAPPVLRECLWPQSQAEYSLPARIGDYTDFYTSIHHATRVGRLFRPDEPLLPNYKWLPIAYHGRASSIGISGQPIQRPQGQVLRPGAQEPVLAPTAKLDYELELGVFMGAGNAAGQPIPVGGADEHVFGLCVLNDWSARDIQAWEYQPLGPFLAKNFATTISPWIVTLEALEPFRVPWSRPAHDPQPLPYLECERNHLAGAFDIQLEAALLSALMREQGLAPQRLSRSNFRHAYWTIAQMVAHHTVNGCPLRAGDLLGTGTQSGPSVVESGSLVELTEGGKWPLPLSSGETRGFLLDGDTVTLSAWCEQRERARVGFGQVSGTVRPAQIAPVPR